ncbi:MAG: leucine-rich repeat protein, partial [Lachnospiraceae bacterium]|nr:leucine-rich repeat protein [Lachnospiraceae bacterium]
VYWLSKSLERKEDEKKRSMVELLYAQALVGENSTEEFKRNAAEYFEKRGDQAIDNGVIGMFYYYNDASMDAEKRIIWTKRAADRGWANAQLIMSLAYLGKEYNKKMILDQDLDACLQYADLLEKNPKATAKDKETIAKIRNTVKAEKDKKKALTEKHLTEAVATDLILELQNTKGKVLRIPDGYTHIDSRAFFHWDGRKPSIKYVKEIEEVIFPESVCYIGAEAFNNVCKLTKINLPTKLEFFGCEAFHGATFGLFGRYIDDKRTVQKLVIPGGCEVEITIMNNAFTGISEISELIFEEGPTSIDCALFEKKKIKSLYIPNSVTKLLSNAAEGRIETISAPSHLKAEVEKLYNIKGKKVTYR